MSEFIPLKQLVDLGDRSVEESIVSRCVLHCLGNLPETKRFTDDVRERGGVDILFTINGHEVSLKRFLEEFQRQHAWIVAKRAEALLDERVGKLLDFVSELERAAREKFKKAFGSDLGEWEP